MLCSRSVELERLENLAMDFISHTCGDGFLLKTRIAAADVICLHVAGRIPDTGQLHGYSLTSCRVKFVILRMRKRGHLIGINIVLN